MIQFSSLNLAAPFLRALHEEGYHTPTPIQAQAIPPILEGRDLLGSAQTGTGKTAAFALPILHRLSAAAPDKSRRGPVLPRALILSPTRELATQIADSFVAYGRHVTLATDVVYGGVSQGRQVRALQRGVDILVATPGRLMDLMEQRVVNLSEVQILVLDEADRMLDMGFIMPIRRIAGAIPKTRQTLLFSATMPKEILRLAESLLRDPVRVSVTPVASAAPLITQSVYMVSRSTKQALLEHTIAAANIGRALVFTKTKHGADRVTQRLNQAGITACAIHGNKAQNQRQRALDAFRNGRSRVLVATDVAARGIDVDGITHVFNYDMPIEAEAYVHRIGRTGRAGATGIAIAFCDHDERGFLRSIERLTGKPIPAVATPALPAQRAPIVDTSRGATQGRAEHAWGSRPGAHAPSRHDQPRARHERPAAGARPGSGSRSHDATAQAKPGAPATHHARSRSHAGPNTPTKKFSPNRPGRRDTRPGYGAPGGATRGHEAPRQGRGASNS